MAHPLTHLTHGIPTRRPFHPAKTASAPDHMFLNGAFLRSHGKGFKEEDRDVLVDLSACPKATTSFEGVVQTFINWAEKHPEEGNLTMHLGVVEALSEIWPCD